MPSRSPHSSGRGDSSFSLSHALVQRHAWIDVAEFARIPVLPGILANSATDTCWVGVPASAGFLPKALLLRQRLQLCCLVIFLLIRQRLQQYFARFLVANVN